MFVAIQHTITDPKKWEEAVGTIGPMVEEGKLPKGLKALLFLPSSDGRRAVCVWEAQSLDAVRQFTEPLTSAGSKNEYFQINVDHAIGLPADKEEPTAVH